jgi:hypothetical protein
MAFGPLGWLLQLATITAALALLHRRIASTREPAPELDEDHASQATPSLSRSSFGLAR